MTATEAIMWAVERDPALRSDFCNLTILESAPDMERLRVKMQRAITLIPHLGERVVPSPLRIAPPVWSADSGIDLDYHLRSVTLDQPSSMRSLLDLASALCEEPFDTSRPLWEFTVIKGLPDGRCALLQKVHHTITDGVGGLRLSLSIVDRDPHPESDHEVQAIAEAAAARQRDERQLDPVNRTNAFETAVSALAYRTRRNTQIARTAIGGSISLALHPQRVPKAISGSIKMLSSLRRQVFVTDSAHSELLSPRSLDRRFDLFTFSLEDAAATAHALDGHVNDVFVTGVSGALGRYHEAMGQPVSELRMAMPVSTRGQNDTSANHFVPTRVLVPTGPKDPTQRFVATRESLRHLRGERALEAAESLADVIASLPTSLLVAATHTQTRTIDFATSNLRGSAIDLWISGARIEANFPIGPRGGCAVNFTTLSYCGVMHVGVNSDPASITDPDALIECLEESFTDLLAIGRGE
ncbi:MAG: wax ester/triacylglycerol synthase domain-containing protein [Actinomycetes bacterium]|jgi:WS/DGAT/MGAT family acyltransferase